VDHAPVRPSTPFDSFRRLVLADRELEAHLRSIPEWPTFIAAALDAAARHGIVLSEADVLAARDAARRSWLERWI
jgi:hypothetical protein